MPDSPLFVAFPPSSRHLPDLTREKSIGRPSVGAPVVELPISPPRRTLCFYAQLSSIVERAHCELSSFPNERDILVRSLLTGQQLRSGGNRSVGEAAHLPWLQRIHDIVPASAVRSRFRRYINKRHPKCAVTSIANLLRWCCASGCLPRGELARDPSNRQSTGLPSTAPVTTTTT